MSDILIRSNRPADAAELLRLAALDSKVLPDGELLVAEVGGEIVAAYEPTTARAVADPFRRTDDIVSILKLRAAGIPEVTHRTRRSPSPIARAA